MWQPHRYFNTFIKKKILKWKDFHILNVEIKTLLSKPVQCNIKRRGTIYWDETLHVLLAYILPGAKIRVKYECMKEMYHRDCISFHHTATALDSVDSMDVQALVWLCCCPPSPEPHDTLGTGIKSSSESWVKTESSPGRIMDSLLLGIFQRRLKKSINGSFTAGEAASLVHTCRSLGSWARVCHPGCEANAALTSLRGLEASHQFL